MEAADLLAVEVEVEEFLLVLDAHADDGPLDVTETDHAFFLVDAQAGNLVLVVVKSILIV